MTRYREDDDYLGLASSTRITGRAYVGTGSPVHVDVMGRRRRVHSQIADVHGAYSIGG
jgi:hypothetical protein